MWMTCCLRLGRNRKKYFSGALGQERLEAKQADWFSGKSPDCSTTYTRAGKPLLFCQMGSLTRLQELGGNHFSKNKRMSNREMLRWIKELREGVPICVVGDTHLSRGRAERRCWGSCGVGSSAAQLWVWKCPLRHRWHVPSWWMLLLALLLLQSGGICSQKMRMRKRKFPLLIGHGLSGANAMGIPL